MDLNELKKDKKALIIGVVLILLVAGGSIYLINNKEVSSSESDSEYVEGALSSEEISLPEDEADVFGIIQSVSGNKITIMELDSSDMPTMDMNKEGETVEGDTAEDRPSREDMTPPSGEMPEDFEPGQMPQDGMQRGARGGNATTDSSLIEELKDKSIGTREITVPVGIAMYKESGRDTWTEVTVADLTENIMVSIWLNEDITDRDVAEALKIGGGMGR